MPRAIRILCLICLLAPSARGHAQVPPPEAPAAHWSETLGRRVAEAERRFPTVDQVVLVPNEATYVQELERWSDRGRWPVLFADDHLAAMFIRRFKPARIIQRAPADDAASGTPVTRQRLEAVVIRAWGGDPQQQSLREAFDQSRHVPPGVVITAVGDPAWTAAVALAAGRGQPIGWLDEAFGRPNQTLERNQMSRLQAAVDRLVVGAGYPCVGLGDAVDAITLCRAVGGRVAVAGPDGESEVRAVTDVLGRLRYGQRYAFTGWIFGDSARCAYAAMCALFLPRDRFLLVNTYPDEGAWKAYGITGAAETLSTRGFQVGARDGDAASLASWLRLLPGGLGTDVVVMNSKGNADFFDLSDGRAFSGDVPVLNEPAAVHLTHSWSMRTPDNPATVAGRWLQRGAYAYVGSVDEPTLSAFVPPRILAARWAGGVPWLIGARRWDTSPAWKLNTFGDPLMICRPPAEDAPQRVTPPAEPGQDLLARVRDLMRQADGADHGAAFAEAIEMLILLGKDDIAVRMWQLAEQRGHDAAAARPALGALFRLRRTEEFLRAWQATDQRDPRATDMLWHLLSPRVPAAGPEALGVLAAAIRRDQPDADLQHLAPHLTAAFGAGRTRELIQRELDRAPQPRIRNRLQQLLRTVR